MRSWTRGWWRRDAAQGIQQHRSDLLNGLGKLREDFLQPQYKVACHKACRQSAEETGLAVRRDHAADKTDCKAGTVRDTLRNIAGENGEHEPERDAADRLEQRCHRSDGTEITSLRFSE